MGEMFDPSARFREQREWHSRKARWNKRWFHGTEMASLVAGAAIPIAILCAGENSFLARLIPALLGAVIVVLSGASKLFKFQENWLQYRTLVEELDREEVLCERGLADYAGIDAAGRTALFIEHVENLLARTTTQYIAAHRSAASKST